MSKITWYLFLSIWPISLSKISSKSIHVVTKAGFPSFYSWVVIQCWRRQWHPTPVLLPGKSQGWRSLVGCSPWGRAESDMTERLPFHFSLSCIGEGNGNPLQCTWLENPRDGGAWWAAVYGVAQSRTRLKRLSSSSSSSSNPVCVCVLHLLYPFIHCWTHKDFLYLGYCE